MHNLLPRDDDVLAWFRPLVERETCRQPDRAYREAHLPRDLHVPRSEFAACAFPAASSACKQAPNVPTSSWHFATETTITTNSTPTTQTLVAIWPQRNTSLSMVPMISEKVPTPVHCLRATYVSCINVWNKILVSVLPHPPSGNALLSSSSSFSSYGLAIVFNLNIISHKPNHPKSFMRIGMGLLELIAWELKESLNARDDDLW